MTTRSLRQMLFDQGYDMVSSRREPPKVDRSEPEPVDLSQDPTFRENTRRVTRELFNMGDDRVPHPNFDPLEPNSQ